MEDAQPALPKAEEESGTNPSSQGSEILHKDLKSQDHGRSIWEGFNGVRFDFDFFRVHVDYGSEGPVIGESRPKTLSITIHNRDKTQANLSLRWYLPEPG